MTTPHPPIVQIPFEMPPEIFEKIISGTHTLSGQMVRNVAIGLYTDQLDPASDVVDISKAVAQPAAQEATGWFTTITGKSDDLAKGLIQSAKNNPGKSVLIAGGLVSIAVTGLAVTNISQKRRAKRSITEQHNRKIHEAARNVDAAIKKWLAAATQAALTEEIVNDLAAAYSAYSGATASAPAALKDLNEQQQDFYARFAEYTVQVAQANGIEFEQSEEPSNIVDLASYIACQQDIFAQAAGS